MTRGAGVLRATLSIAGFVSGIVGLLTGILTDDVTTATYLLTVAAFMLLLRTVVGDKT